MKYIEKPIKFDAVQFDGTQASADAVSALAGFCSINGNGNLILGIHTVAPTCWVVMSSVGLPNIMDNDAFQKSFEAAP